MEQLNHLYEIDIKECLKNLIDAKKSRNPRFSQRAFANRLGFTSSTFNEIVTGKRRLSKRSIAKIEQGLSNDPDLKKIIYESAKVSLSKRWYYHAFLELVATEDFREDSAWISQRLGISEEQARFSLEELVRGGSLLRNSSGVLTLAEGLQRKGHLRLLESPEGEDVAKISEVMKEVSSAERFFGTLVMAIDPKDFEYIRSKVLSVMEEHSDFLRRDGVKCQEVYLLSFGCVPLTKRVSAGKER